MKDYGRILNTTHRYRVHSPLAGCGDDLARSEVKRHTGGRLVRVPAGVGGYVYGTTVLDFF